MTGRGGEAGHYRIGIDVGRKLSVAEAIAWAADNGIKAIDCQIDIEPNPLASFDAARCAALRCASIPLVAAHNDLTMWNVLLAPGGAVGVVDWEHATAGSLPLVDLFYALADAVMTAGRHPDRLAAVAACIGAAGPHAALARRLWSQLAADLALPDTLVTLAFHACWLHHGANAADDLRDRDRDNVLDADAAGRQ